MRDEPSQSPAATARSPFCRLPATSSPGRGKSFEGRALGKKGRSRPYSSTAGGSLPLSCKLSALAKASPFRERWHGEAVTERVTSGSNPLSRLRRQLVPLFVAYRRHLPPAGGSLSTQVEALAKRVSFVLTGQRQKKSTDKPISFPPQRILHVFWFYYTVFAGGCTAPGAFLSRRGNMLL